MSQGNAANTVRAKKAVRQYLQSLESAGLTHVKKPAKAARKKSAPPAVDSSLADSSKQALVSGAKGTKASAPTEIITDRAAALAEIAKKVAKCRRCKELAETRTQTVFGVGNPYSKLVFCGEAPGADEDKKGEPFVGRAGQLLTDIIEKGMKLRREDVYILNILRCRPPGNRTPLPVEADACREYLEGQLAVIQPEFVCCLGACAAQNFLKTEETIGRLRGRIHLLPNGIKVLCTYHPAYLLRNPPAKKFVWDDIQILMAEMGLK